MGKNRNKSKKTERLPPSERSVVGPKVSTIQPHNLGQPARHGERASRAQAAASHSTGRTTQLSMRDSLPENAVMDTSIAPRSRGCRVELDDDTLRRVLRHAGVLAMLNAQRVCRNWRRIATEELEATNTLDVSAALRQGRVTLSPNYAWFTQTVDRVPNLRHLSLARLPYTELLPDLPSYMLGHIASASIATLDLSGLSFTSADLCGAIRAGRLPALRNLIMMECDGVNGDLTRRLVDAMRSQEQTLNAVDLSGCIHMDAPALGPLLTQERVVGMVTAKRCINIRRVISSVPLTATGVDLHHCRNLGRFHVNAAALEVCNLSQCTSLVSVQLRTPRRLRVLNLALCSSLRVLATGAASLTPQPQAECGLCNIEELVLSRARCLVPEILENELRLASTVCAMPNLRRLDLVDTQIRDIKLCGYKLLESVNVSGCADLNRVEVRDVDRLKELSIGSRKAPLASVMMSLPRSTKVLGVRKEWSWQRFGTTQTIEHHP